MHHTTGPAIEPDKAARASFCFDGTVYLGHTNAEGNVYFAKFFEWQGMAREEFYRSQIPSHMELLKAGIRIVTVEAHVEFKNQLFLFDQFCIDVKTRNIRTASLELVFTYTNKVSQQLVAVGWQKIAFADAGGKLLSLPEEIRQRAGLFQA